MDSKKLNLVLIGALVLLGLGLLGSARQANAILGSKSKTLVGLKVQEQAAIASQQRLVKDKKDIATYSDLNTIAKSVVPQDKDQAEAVQEIANLAAQSGIPRLSSITFPPSTLGGTAAGAKASGGLTQLTPAKGIPGVYALQITITQSNSTPVPYGSFVSFLTKLEQNRRTAQVSSINIQPDQKNPNVVSFTLIINEFIKP